MDLLRAWFTAGGGSFHPDVVLDPNGPYGVSVLAPRLVEDTTIVSCPFSLIVTKDVASHALQTLLDAPLDDWSARQLICSYLCFHRLFPEQSLPDVLRHLPYVQALPLAEKLMTPLQFVQDEREVLRGTNLYGATLDRERDWHAEWIQCRALLHGVNPAWGDAFTWTLYLTASTHLSSRAFPSSILSPDPSLIASPSTCPVLIPCFDLLNHKRAQPVSWVVSCPDGVTAPDGVSLLVHPSDNDSGPTGSLFQVFNNYGPKPNDEFILGYGFSLPDNPDDTIVLQIGGGSATPTSAPHRCVVGRHARNADSLWTQVKSMLAPNGDEKNVDNDYAFEDDLEAAAVLSDMVQAKLDGIPTVEDVRQRDGVRPAVKVMLEHYVAGQRDILDSILEFLSQKREAAIEAAREQGIDLVFDDEDEDG